MNFDFGTILALGIALFVIITILKTARIVPQRSNFVIERLGKFSRTLDSGFHLLVPFIDKVAYQHTLKEEVIDVKEVRKEIQTIKKELAEVDKQVEKYLDELNY